MVDVHLVDEETDLMFVTDRGKILRTKATNFRSIGRNTQGVRLMVLETNERIVSVAKLAEKDELDEPAEAEEGAEEAGTGSTEE